MKKIFSMAVLVLLTQLSFAQYFKLTDKGFVSNENHDFAVVEVPNVKQMDVYKNVLNAINSLYSNPQKGLSVLEGESITLTAYEEKALPVRHGGGGLGKSNYQYDLSYTLSFLFKDGKIRMNSPTFELRRWYERTSKNGSNWGRSGWRMLNLVEDKKNSTAIYDQNGKLILEDAANGLNTHLNALLKQIIDKSNTINNW
ncbi:hypothetical protein MUB18_15550 [Sphingobacterium sp. PCS056]|uniref:hypothetical protein n=1 Tax=Sphingobacterium sp. PCS056 TaxID=2931400 RepID=UPI00200EA525|nr:hypothetical protein [Sphingobacterium sp. PCS056]UPZ35518.1 hypothetical protein MUB18_15550 [Sphingobacterium sp. PCS056]